MTKILDLIKMRERKIVKGEWPKSFSSFFSAKLHNPGFFAHPKPRRSSWFIDFSWSESQSVSFAQFRYLNTAVVAPAAAAAPASSHPHQEEEEDWGALGSSHCHRLEKHCEKNT